MTDLSAQTEQQGIRRDVGSSASSKARSPDRGASSIPWYSEPGVEGMEATVERLKEVARQVEERVAFTTPWVHRFAYDGEGQDETIHVVVDVLIPLEWDGFEFRDRFFDLLTEAIDPADENRLAVGVGYRSGSEAD